MAAYSATTNELTITLNSNANATVTSTAIDTVVSALAGTIANVTTSGPLNIDVASLTNERHGGHAVATGRPRDIYSTRRRGYANVDFRRLSRRSTSMM